MTLPLFQSLIAEVERPRMPDARKFADAHKVEKHADVSDDTNKPNESREKDKSRRADPAQGEDEAKYADLQPDDKSAKALAAYASKMRNRSASETTGGNTVEYNQVVHIGGTLAEGVMAKGILDRDPAKAKKARAELKKLLKKPLPASIAADKLYPLFFSDDLFDELDWAEKNKVSDVRPVVELILKRYNVSLNEGFVPSEFVGADDVLMSEQIDAVMPETTLAKCGRFEQVNSYRNQVSNVLSDLIVTRRNLNSLHSALCWSVGRTELGAAACEALEAIVASHNALLQDVLTFEDDFCSQEFVKAVRAEMGYFEDDGEDEDDQDEAYGDEV